MRRRKFLELSGAAGAYLSSVAAAGFSSTDNAIRWSQNPSTKLFDQVSCDSNSLVKSDAFGLLQGFCSMVKDKKTMQVLSANKNEGLCGSIQVRLRHELHDTRNGVGEDCLEGILELQNTSNQSQFVEIGFMTSALPFDDIKQQKAYLPLTAAGLSKDKRMALLGSADFLENTEQPIGSSEFACHYLEPMASNPGIRSTRALLLAPVVDLYQDNKPQRMALFTSSLEPMEFKTVQDDKHNRGWQCSRCVEIKPGEKLTCRCFLLFHTGDASVAWKAFHNLAHHEDFEPVEWLSKIRVHYYDFLSSAKPDTRRGGGYESDLEFFKQFQVGMATQHGYYPALGDYLHPDRKTWQAMRTDKHGAVDMSIEKMQARIKATREAGTHPAVYLHMVLFDEASPLYSKLKDSILLDPDGKPMPYPWNGPDTAKKNWRMSVASKEWRDNLIQQAQWIMEILNPDAIVMDETFSGWGYEHHPDRSGPLSGFGIELIREIRKVIRSFGNDKALLSSDCSMSNMVMWSDGESGDHAYGSLLGHKLYLQEPVRYRAALGDKPWRPCAWHFQHFWNLQMDLARRFGAGVGVSNGWIEYTGLRYLPKSARNKIISDISSLM